MSRAGSSTRFHESSWYIDALPPSQQRVDGHAQKFPTLAGACTKRNSHGSALMLFIDGWNRLDVLQ